MKQEKSIPKCKVISFKKGIHKIEVVPEEEAFKFKTNNYHIFIDEVRMKVIIKLTKGKQKKFNGKIERVDGMPLGLLKKLMMRPGVFLTPYEIGNTGEHIDSYFIKDNIIQYVAKLRKYLFYESGRKHKFICTSSRPYKIALNGDINFCWIERYHDSLESNVITEQSKDN